LSIFGVDIASGSPSSRRMPSYSLVILEGDATISHHMINRHKLIRLIRERQPEIVAMDNVHELASDRSELINLMRRLPAATQLVQVTGGERPESLVRLARWNGITFDRTKPLQEAEACARLAAKGVGAVISAFEERTWIKVSRRRSLGRGGWSQNRYSRKIHGAVKGLARDVERQLREAGLEYTARVVEGLGGYTRAEFVVEATREKVHINSGYSADAQLKVQSIERPELQFKPLLQRRGYIIVGLDPGTTTGIAALNLGGDLVDLISSRAMSSSDVIEWIAARGRPLVVATDVFPTPGAVEKVKRAFNAVLYSPGADMPGIEKIALGREVGYRNDHERDALAAALSAFKKYKNKFLQVEKKAPPEVDPDEVKALVVRGYSIENAVAEFTKAPEIAARPAASPPAAAANADPENNAQRLQNQQLAEQVRTLRSYVDELRAELVAKEAALQAAVGKLDRLKDKTAREIKRQHEIKIRDKEIERLRAILRSERKYAKKLKKNMAARKKAEQIEVVEGLRRLKPLQAFSREAVLLAIDRYALAEGDLVFLEDASGGGKSTAELIKETGIAAVISDDEMAPALQEYFLDLGVPVFSGRELPVQRIDGLPFVRPEDVESAQMLWTEQMKARQVRLQAEKLESLFQDYKVERMKEEKRKKRMELADKI
jgi:predicted RNase H-like nuclease (RuvC/YqgF family)